MIKNKGLIGAGEMVQCLGTLTPLQEDLRLVLTTYVLAHNCLYYFQGI